MTPERHADLHRRYDGLSADAYAVDHPVSHVVELLAHIRENAADELTRQDRRIEAEAELRQALMDADATTSAAEAERNSACADRDRLATRVNELEAELAERENDIPARITAETQRDQSRAEADRLQWLLDQLIARHFIGTRELCAVITERPAADQETQPMESTRASRQNGGTQ